MTEQDKRPGRREYLMTLEQLYQASLANLGPMKVGSYDEFVEKMEKVAQEKSVANPLMVIDIILKQPSEFGITEQPYPIADFEWDQFASEAPTMAKKMPDVHVVDGDRYTAPI